MAASPAAMCQQERPLLAQITFTIRQDRSTPFNPADLVWKISGNTRPVAHAGRDQTVQVNATVQLNGSESSDMDGEELTFQWELRTRPLGGAATLTNPTAVLPTFVADKPGNYEIQLVVKDLNASSTPDTVVISTTNSAPTANAGPDQTVSAGGSVQLDGSASSDPDGDPLTYQWTLTSTPAGSTAVLAGSTTPAPSFVADKAGTYRVRLIVKDGVTESDADIVIVSTENSAPVANAGPDLPGLVNQTIQLNGHDSSDVDGDPLSYRWSFISVPDDSNTVLSDSTIVNPTFIPDVVGLYVVQLIVNDGKVDSAPNSAKVTITVGECEPGATQACYTGPGGTKDVGLCRGGTETCQPDGTFGPCEGEVLPAPEIPGNGIDEDCNGQDEPIGECTPGEIKECYDGPSETKGVGQCKAGTKTCKPDKTFGVCDGQVLPAPEIPGNGVDEDCNGSDEITPFIITAQPGATNVLQGSSVSYTVSLSATSSFSQLATLNVVGLPLGVSGSFSAPTITAGQSATLTVQASQNAAETSTVFTVTGTAQVNGQDVTQSASASVTVLAGGRTALLGQIRLVSGTPLANVKVSVTDKTTQTDSGGNFLLLDLPAGDQVMSVDATPANPKFPIFGVSVTLVAGQAVQLPPQFIYPPPPSERFTPIQNATQAQVITDARYPGASFTLPAGVTITGWDGILKSQMAMERLSPDRLPVPPPPGPTRSLYQPFFGTPMGGLPSAPIPVTLPNDLDLKPGEKAELWYYDAAPLPGVPGEWRKAGLGTVSEDGTTIASDPGVGIERFCGVCGMSCFISLQKAQPNRNPDGCTGSNPVDLFLGQTIVEKTDLTLQGRIPAVIHRTYNPHDPFRGIAGFQLGLGPGWALSVDVVLEEESSKLRTLILPGNARFSFVLQPDGSFINTTRPRFAGATLSASGGEYFLRFKDGAQWRFVPGSVGGIYLLAEQLDPNGNRLLIERSGNQVSRIVEPAGRA